MENVQFEEDQNISSFRSRTVLGTPTTPKMVRFLVKIGFAKNDESAGRLLLIATVLIFLLAVTQLYFNVPASSNKTPKYIEDLPFFDRADPAYSNLPHKLQ